MSELRHLINITDLSVEEIDHLIEVADDIIENPEAYQDICRHKKGFDQAASSSASKGESVSDTVTMVSGYADIIAMRHPKEGAPFVAARRATVPIINGGDGGHFHPTQTLTDLMTIHRKKGEFKNLTIGLCGDLKFGRTVHSLIEAMIRYENIRFIMISPEELDLPEYIKETLDNAGIEWKEVRRLEDAIPELDVLYMTRVQRERFFNEEDYIRLKDSFVLHRRMLDIAKEDMIVMHPLPRVNEISVDVDDDPRAAYFFQALMGKYIRMALILFLLGMK